MSKIYGHGQATWANVTNADDDDEEICEDDDMSMNIGCESVNEPFTEDFIHSIHSMSNTPHSNIVP